MKTKTQRRAAKLKPQGAPRYKQIADDLLDKIQAGKLAVGSVLRPEEELCVQYRASRGTVRRSLAFLQDLGVIQRKQREGTSIISRFASVGKLDNRQVLEHWAQFGIDNPLSIESISYRSPPPGADGVADAKSKWLCIVGLRYPIGSKIPISFAQSFVHPDFAEIELTLARTSIPIYAQVEQRYGRTIAAVRASIRSISLPDAVAQKLGAMPGSPALEVTRYYLDVSRRTISIAVNVHPAERYTYSIEVERS
ncbi:GntR family transcriptional regulator [Microbacteriaceae bacterium K1510]|nr:GntR family transcriptional regulator [Microbacteriaceae bacterium K1510]